MSQSAEVPWFEVHAGLGPFCLLVHGMLSSRVQWLPNLEALAPVCRPVVLELYGHGRSPSPSDRTAFHPDRYVEAFERILEKLGVGRWLLLGQSLGAALTLRYALTHPERIAAHVFTNSNSAFAHAEWAEQLRPNMEALVGAVATSGLAAIEQIPVHPRHSRRLSPEVKQALVEDAAGCDPLGIAFSGAETVVNSPQGDRISRNRVPTLLIVGRREERFRAQVERARIIMPQLEVRELEAGHAVNLEAADDFNGLVVPFLARHAPH